MQGKLVSIIIPTYNRKYVIEKAINSCVNQTYKNIEIIICDDHSTDGTQEYIAGWMQEDKRIKYCVTPSGKKGANAARNAGIKLARGEYLAFLDSDDYLTEESIACRVVEFEKNPNVGMVYGNALCESGIKKIKWIYTDINKELINQRRYFMQELSLCCMIVIMVKASVFAKIGLLPEEQKAWNDDWLCTAVGMRYSVVHSGKFVAVVRQSKESITSNKWDCFSGCRILVDYYRKQIIQYSSFRRYLLWKIRLLSLYCQAKEKEEQTNTMKQTIWTALHVVTRKIIYPFFRNHFE